MQSSLLPVVTPERACADAWYRRLQEEIAEFQLRNVTPSDLLRPIENVLVVGALYRDYPWAEPGDAIEPLLDHDYLRVKDALELCVTLSIAVSPTFKPWILNLNEAGEGNFLTATGSADLVVLCCLYNGASPKIIWGGLFADSDGARQADEHRIEGVWHKAAKGFGARVIVTYGGHHEVNASTFLPALGEVNDYRVYERFSDTGLHDPMHAKRSTLILQPGPL